MITMPSWLKTIGSYFKALIQPDYGEIPHAERARSLAKWVFDFLRNLLIVGVLKYFAVKTESTAINLVADIAFLFFWVYCFSYLSIWSVYPFHFLKNKFLANLLDATANIMVFIFLYLVTLDLLTTVVNELAKANVR